MTKHAAPADAVRSPDIDERLMDAALGLARRGWGETAPNPSVAALVVRFEGETPIVLGRGRTAPGGRPHAERRAIAQAGDAARGATIYVTLEPCATRSVRDDGASCTDAILAAGLARVVIGATDPSLFASGEGTARLKAAGLDVRTGVRAAEARRVALGHILRVSQHRPLVSLKMARTADGFAGTADGRQLMITGEISARHTHLARSQSDAIMVGAGTQRGDDPKLNVRLAGLEHRSPIRVILDSGLRTRPDAFVVRDAARTPTWIFAGYGAPQDLADPLSAAGVDVTRALTDAKGRLSLTEVLSVLAARGVTRLMVEGGPTLAEALCDADLVDELTLMTGPVAVGDGLPAIRPGLARWLGDARTAKVEEAAWGADRAEFFERRR